MLKAAAGKSWNKREQKRLEESTILKPNSTENSPPSLHLSSICISVLEKYFLSRTCDWQARRIPRNQSGKRWPDWSEMQSFVHAEAGAVNLKEISSQHISLTYSKHKARPTLPNDSPITLECTSLISALMQILICSSLRAILGCCPGGELLDFLKPHSLVGWGFPEWLAQALENSIQPCILGNRINVCPIGTCENRIVFFPLIVALSSYLCGNRSHPRTSKN